MKVVILAGGLGTRLGEETSVRPKPMVGIGGFPILWHIMKIYSHYGFNDFVVLTGYKQEVIKDYFVNYYMNNSDVTVDLSTNAVEVHQNHSEPFKVTLLYTGRNTKTAGRIKKAQKYIGNEPFMLTYGDGVGDVGEEVASLDGGDAGPEEDVGVTGGVDDHFGGDEFASGLGLDDESAAACAVHDRFGGVAVHEDVDALVLEERGEHQGEELRGVGGDVASVRLLGGLSVEPFVGERIVAVGDGEPEHLLGHAEDDLRSAPVAHGDEEVDESGGGEAAEHEGALQEEGRLAVADSGKCRRRAGDAAAGHHHIVPAPHGKTLASLQIVHSSAAFCSVLVPVCCPHPIWQRPVDILF